MSNAIIKPELLSPAGDMDKLKVAFHFGADAVYVGLTKFSLRAKTTNFTLDELKEAIAYVNGLSKKIYVALNIYVTPTEIKELIEYLQNLAIIKPHGLIISDLGALFLARQYAPQIPLHISTQANITNQYAIRLLKDYGIERVIAARELSLKDISLIAEEGVTIETFIHGAMCIAYSGRCLLSAYMTHPSLSSRPNLDINDIRSANQGNCSHSCRWEYILKEKSRMTENYEIEENESGTFIFSSKDLAMIDHLPDLIAAGVKAFKIEGRMKSILYISGIIRAYRRAIDVLFDSTLPYDREAILQELNVVSHREFCTGFFYDSPKKEPQVTRGGVYCREYRLGAMVQNTKGIRAILKIYNTLSVDSKLQYIAPQMVTYQVAKILFYGRNNETLSHVNHGDYVEVELYDQNDKIIPPQILDIIRMEYDF